MPPTQMFLWLHAMGRKDGQPKERLRRRLGVLHARLHASHSSDPDKK